MQKSFFSIPEFATAISVSRPTVERMWRAGKIRTLTIGSRRVVPVGEIERLTATADFTGKAAASVVTEAQ